jgi:hypothetical protein
MIGPARAAAALGLGPKRGRLRRPRTAGARGWTRWSTWISRPSKAQCAVLGMRCLCGVRAGRGEGAGGESLATRLALPLSPSYPLTHTPGGSPLAPAPPPPPPPHLD